MTPVDIPVIRRGKPYESIEHANVVDHRTAALLATVSPVNAGIIRKDLARSPETRAALEKFTVAQLIEISAKAGELFLNETLPVGDKGHKHGPEDYVETLSSTSGLPHVMVKRN